MRATTKPRDRQIPSIQTKEEAILREDEQTSEEEDVVEHLEVVEISILTSNILSINSPSSCLWSPTFNNILKLILSLSSNILSHSKRKLELLLDTHIQHITTRHLRSNSSFTHNPMLIPNNNSNTQYLYNNQVINLYSLNSRKCSVKQEVRRSRVFKEEEVNCNGVEDLDEEASDRIRINKFNSLLKRSLRNQQKT